MDNVKSVVKKFFSNHEYYVLKAVAIVSTLLIALALVAFVGFHTWRMIEDLFKK